MVFTAKRSITQSNIEVRKSYTKSFSSKDTTYIYTLNAIPIDMEFEKLHGLLNSKEESNSHTIHIAKGLRIVILH